MAQVIRAKPATKHKALRFERGPLDLIHLARQTFGDEGLECEVLRMFDTVAASCHERLKESVTPIERLAQLSSLRLAATGVGAFALAEAVKAAEAEVLECGEASGESLARLAAALDEVSGFVSNLIRSRGE